MLQYTVSVLTLLVLWWEEHPACKNLTWAVAEYFFRSLRRTLPNMEWYLA